MGSYLSRNLRDVLDAAGCDGIAPLDSSEDDVNDAFRSDKHPITQKTNPRPVTPVPHHRTRFLSLDPRSPSFGIVRTPIEVTATPDSNSKVTKKVESDTHGTERNYLETDLDSFDDINAHPSTPVTSVSHKLPAGLSASHLLKLKFLEMDPRSPSEGIVRTPIQVLVSQEKQSNDGSSKEKMDTSSLSLSRSLFGSSEESVDISKACSEPSAIVSDYEQSKDWSLSLSLNELEQEEVNFGSVEPEAGAEVDLKSDFSEENSDQSCDSEESISSERSDEMKVKRDEEFAKEIIRLAEKISQTPISNRLSTGVHIFNEDSTQTPQNTPKKKSTRTPLTPICNLTPNDVIGRGKKIQGKSLKKEKLVCKILSGCENTPSKQKSVLTKKGKKPIVDENARLGEWDQDTTIII